MADGIVDLSTDKYVAAWLYEFDIDHDNLKSEHRRWLDSVLVKRMASAATRGEGTPSGSSTWYIWITGAASRTGSRQHNLSLSKRRTESVTGYVRTRVRGANVVFRQKPIGENFWSLIGRPDEVESRFQRGVLVSARLGSPIEPDIKVPAPKKPHVPVSVRFCHAADRYNFVNINRWHGSLFAFVSTINQDTTRYARFWWPTSATGIHVTPDAVVPKPPMATHDAIFAGYDEKTFNSVYDLDYLGRNFISITTVHHGMTFKIKDASPNAHDIALEFKTNVGWELGQTAIAVIGRMQHLSTSQFTKAFLHGLPVWDDKDKKWLSVA